MKNYLLIFVLALFHLANAQVTIHSNNIPFSTTDFSDSSRYEMGIKKLSTDIIRIYSNTDKAGYFNDLFRIYFAKNEFTATIQSLDSFATLVVPDKSYKNVPGFHYRVHCMTILATQDNFVVPYEKAFEKTFNNLYLALPDDGSKPVEATAIYHIDGGKIKKVYFIK